MRFMFIFISVLAAVTYAANIQINPPIENKPIQGYIAPYQIVYIPLEALDYDN